MRTAEVLLVSGRYRQFDSASVRQHPIPSGVTELFRSQIPPLGISSREFFILPHSHLLVRHLLKQLELHKRDRKERDRRPAWLSTFVHQTAALFEPLNGVAKVGYQCELTPEGWEARLYLGSTEIIGGRDDGHARFSSFEFDFARLTDGFTRVDEFRWNVCQSGEGSSASFVTLRGQIDNHPVSLKLYSRPPKDATPAFRQHTDGTMEDVASV